jgi:uncharacterized protein YbjT (DUF2867 family)
VILVTGATGLNGSQVVRCLCARGVPVRALVRDVRKADTLAQLPGVTLVEGDMSQPQTLREPLRGVDRAMLISSADAHMAEVQLNFVAAAKEAGVALVVKLSGIMPDLDSPFRFARMHGEVEVALERSGMAYTHLRAGEFMQAYFRQAPSIIARGSFALPMADARIASIDVHDIAEVAAEVLTSAGHAGKTYPLTGAEALSMSEVAERLTAALDRPVQYIDIPSDVYRAGLGAAGVPAFNADALVELFAERRAGKESTVHPTAEQLLGRKPTSFAQFAQRNAAVFRAPGG